MLRVLRGQGGGRRGRDRTSTDRAMQLCGGAAFRKELGIERRFRDARAARVMAPTTDALLDFVGRAITRPAAVRRCRMIGDTLLWARSPTTRRSSRSGTASGAGSRAQDLAFDYVLYSNYERQVEDLLAGHIDVAWNSPLAWVRSRAARRGRRRRGVERWRSCATPTATSPRWWWSAPTRPSGRWPTCRDDGRRSGAVDSPQATLIPLSLLRGAGLDPGADATCAASTSASGCTATTSAASATPPALSWPARSTPRA